MVYTTTDVFCLQTFRRCRQKDRDHRTQKSHGPVEVSPLVPKESSPLDSVKPSLLDCPMPPLLVQTRQEENKVWVKTLCLCLFAPEPDLLVSGIHRSNSNGTTAPDGVTFFVIQGLASLGDTQMVVFVFLLLGYIIILGGNCLILVVVLTDPKLSSPMYFFLSHLSFVDMVYTTTTIPKLLCSLLWGVTTISVPGCFLQMFFFVQLGATGHSILTVMAYDRYVAICRPLHYGSIMTRPVQLLLVAGAWSFSILCTLPAAAITWQEPYCGPNVVRHGWCDPASVRRLACADTTVDNLVSLFSALVSLLSTGVLILSSYILIGVSISKMAAGERLKALGTCAAHLSVVTVSYTSASFVYISYRVGNFPPELMVIAVLYSALTPFLNPLIYSLRNKELQDAIRRTLSRISCAAASAAEETDTDKVF
ncbi:olfactory receptor 6N1-like [Betta splendens]|uniref:Olfactory receptor 6N1-like n=1 Tax=Betta splendens TaxID=158456 RepID=A0A9W2X8N6_BETSP|nr:olfactory receptor 6N1-like [Betta splendens]